MSMGTVSGPIGVRWVTDARLMPNDLTLGDMAQYPLTGVPSRRYAHYRC